MRRLDPDRFSPAVLRIVQRAWGLCRAGGREEVTLESLWTALRIEESEARERLAEHDLTLDPLDGSPLPALPPVRMFDDRVRAVLREADRVARGTGRQAIAGSDHLLWAILDRGDTITEAAGGFDLDRLTDELTTDAGTIDAGVLLEEPPPPVDDASLVLRLLDASANRLGEGLRVVEDYVRFVMDDAGLSESCKALRHAVAPLLNHLPVESRTAVREVAGDVGTEIELPSEQARGSGRDVLMAALRRSAESLRSLEEYSKTRDGELARNWQTLRYRLYEVESQIVRTLASVDRIGSRRLMLLIGLTDLPSRLETIVEAAIAGGVDCVQLREKAVDDGRLLAAARSLREICRSTETLLIINDRADIAVLAEADGVHVGQDDLPCAEARRIVGGDRLVGVSTHSPEQAEAARAAGADYIGCGPTFPSQTKTFDAFVGPDFYRRVTEQISLPAFAIGGLTAANAGKLHAETPRIAVSRAITHAEHPEFAARQLRDALDAERVSPNSD